MKYKKCYNCEKLHRRIASGVGIWGCTIKTAKRTSTMTLLYYLLTATIQVVFLPGTIKDNDYVKMRKDG